ncbi:MAG: hypothetical protein RMK65_07555 [Anaerolineae bacterium]|nr:hypothetical protein [Anaerolineae bacterium]
MNDLERIGEEIRTELTARGRSAREALRRSREPVRLCGTAVRAASIGRSGRKRRPCWPRQTRRLGRWSPS